MKTYLLHCPADMVCVAHRGFPFAYRRQEWAMLDFDNAYWLAIINDAPHRFVTTRGQVLALDSVNHNLSLVYSYLARY